MIGEVPAEPDFECDDTFQKVPDWFRNRWEFVSRDDYRVYAEFPAKIFQDENDGSELPEWVFYDSQRLPGMWGFNATPNWGYWKNVRVAEIEVAVALAMDISPAAMRCQPDFLRMIAPEAEHKYKAVCAVAADRIDEIARPPHANGSSVDLIGFGRFYTELHGVSPLAKEYPAPVTESDLIDNAKPPYYTSKLLALFRIMEELERNKDKTPAEVIKSQTGYTDERSLSTVMSIVKKCGPGRPPVRWPCESPDDDQ